MQLQGTSYSGYEENSLLDAETQANAAARI
jgi:hypothetical protein